MRRRGIELFNGYTNKIFKILALKHIKSIKTKFVLIFVLLILMPMIIFSSIAYHRSSTALNTQVSKYTLLIMKQLNKNVNNFVEQMDKISKVPMLDYKELGSDVQKILKEGNEISALKRIDNEYKMRDFFLNLKFMDKYIVNITIYTQKGSIYSFDASIPINNNYKEEEWYKKAVEANGNKVLLGTHKQMGEAGNLRQVFSFVRQINDFYTRKPLGIIVIDADIKVIKEIIKEIDLGSDGNIVIASENGSIIVNNNERYISRKIGNGYLDKILEEESGELIQKVEGENLLITWYTSEFTGWKLIGIVPKREINRDILLIRNSLIIIMSLFIVFTFLVFTRISSSMINPINKLRRLMKEAERGDFNISINIDTEDEIKQLGSSFNLMIRKIKQLIDEVYNVELEKKQAELNALQSQINPHYLYNTLESIKMTAALNDDMEVMNMISILADTFRYSINIKNEVVTVEQEIKHVNNYISIQKMRYQDRLQADINIDKEIMNYKIIKLVIQPIVENSIYHGLGEKTGNGHISITGKKEGDKIKFEIMDDGVGMTERQLQEIRYILKNGKHTNNRRSIGLLNINERLRLYFGDAYSMDIASSPGTGTKVTLNIPIL